MTAKHNKKPGRLWRGRLPVYNMVVIGTGPEGLAVARNASRLGAKVALVAPGPAEEGFGPPEALVAAMLAEWTYRLTSPGSRGIDSGGEPLFTRVMDLVRQEAERFKEINSPRSYSEDPRVDVFSGPCRFLDRKTVSAGDKRLRFRKAAITSCTRPKIPDIEGLRKCGFITGEDILGGRRLPERIVVIGSGPLAASLAQSHRRLGAEVTVLLKSRFLRHEDSDAVAVLESAMNAEGIEIIRGAHPLKAESTGAGKKITAEIDERMQAFEADEIVVAEGREPELDQLGLEDAGIEYDRRTGVKIDQRLRTANRRVFAAGCLCADWRQGHAPQAASRLIAANALFNTSMKVDPSRASWRTCTDPQVAHAGLYEHEAREKGVRVDTVKIMMSDVGQAVDTSGGEGFIKVHFSGDTRRLLGATAVGSGAGETMSTLSLAMSSWNQKRALAQAAFPYPAKAEAVRMAVQKYREDRRMKLEKKALNILMSLKRLI